MVIKPQKPITVSTITIMVIKKDHNRKKQLQMKENEKGKEKNVEKELMEEFKV